jgi:hypothetical protein
MPIKWDDCTDLPVGCNQNTVSNTPTGYCGGATHTATCDLLADLGITSDHPTEQFVKIKCKVFDNTLDDAGNPKSGIMCMDKWKIPPGVVLDPLVYGFGGGWFQFHGRADEVFNLISDEHLQMNSRFFFEATPAGYTWLGDMGIQVGADKIAFLKNGTQSLNGQDLAQGTYTLRDGGRLVVGGASIGLNVPKFDIVLNLAQDDYGVIHFNMHVDYEPNQYAKIPHGVIGQTADDIMRLQDPEDAEVRKTYIAGGAKICEGLNAYGCVEGSWKDYMVLSNDIFGRDFTFNRFTARHVHFVPADPNSPFVDPHVAMRSSVSEKKHDSLKTMFDA